MDGGFVLRFLLSNAILAVFLLGVLGVKRLSRKQLTTSSQFRISLVALVALIAPFIPVQYAGLESLWRWFALGTSGSHNTAGTAATAETAGNLTQNSNWLQDFAVTINPTPQANVYTALGVILVVGAVTMLALTVYKNIRLKQIKNSIGPIESKKTLQIFEQCKQEVGCRREIKLAYSPLVTSPMMYGFFRPCIVMPSDISNGDSENIRCAMLHEIYHCKRWDMAVNYLVAVFHVVYWFNPAVWFFLSNTKKELELDCDHSVLELLGDDNEGVVAYGKTLLGFASGGKRRTDLLLAAEIGGTLEQLSKRIGNIAGYETDTKGKKAKSLLAFLLVLVFTLLCVPSFSALAKATDTFRLTNENIVAADYSDLFGAYEGAFVLYNPSTDEYMVYNEGHALTRYSPQSTYKIYSSLQALESGIITVDDSDMEWDGVNNPYAQWNRNHNLNTAMASSVSWYFQNLDSQAGLAQLQNFYSNIGYGNSEVKSTDMFWMDGSLLISTIEQVQMLQRFYHNDFGFDETNVQAVKDAIFLEASNGVRLYGKTGTGTSAAVSSDGWYIGYIESGDEVYYFATHIQGEGASGSSAAQIALGIFEREGLYTR